MKNMEVAFFVNLCLRIAAAGSISIRWMTIADTENDESARIVLTTHMFLLR